MDIKKDNKTDNNKQSDNQDKSINLNKGNDSNGHKAVEEKQTTTQPETEEESKDTPKATKDSKKITRLKERNRPKLKARRPIIPKNFKPRLPFNEQYVKDKNLDENDLDDAKLEKMEVKECFELRRKCAENGDIKSLLTIAKYNFIHGSAETHFPELCYYYGRLHRFEELQEFLNENKKYPMEFYLFMLPDSCKELAQNLLNIGLKFPHLNEQEISYLEQKYCDSKTFELFDIIMFDSDKLARPIKKFDKNLLNVKNTDFSRDFLLKVFGHFSENEELDDGYSQLYVYSRITNKVIRKKYEDVGLGEYCIVHPIHSNEFYNLLNEKYGAECADYCIAELLFIDDDLESFKTSNFYLLNAENIEEVANDYFQNSSKVEDLKAEIARLWLNKINLLNIRLI